MADVRLRSTKLFIRPANILLSDKDVPVLVDFGFAEKYDLGSSKAFRSNLAYGTPEVRSLYFLFAHCSSLVDRSIFRQNVLVDIPMTPVSLTFGRSESLFSKYSSVARHLSMWRVSSFRPRKTWRNTGPAQ